MTITLTYIGSDEFDRAVLKGDNGRFYKTTEPNILNKGIVPEQEKTEFMQSLHTTDDPFGEPGFPCMETWQFIFGNF